MHSSKFDRGDEAFLKHPKIRAGEVLPVRITKVIKDSPYQPFYSFRYLEGPYRNQLSNAFEKNLFTAEEVETLTDADVAEEALPEVL